MTFNELIAELMRRCIVFDPHSGDGRLYAYGPRGALTLELRRAIQVHRRALIAFLGPFRLAVPPDEGVADAEHTGNDAPAAHGEPEKPL